MTSRKPERAEIRPRPGVPELTLQVAAGVLAREAGLRLDRDGRGRLERCVIDEAAAWRTDVSDYVARLGVEAGLLQGLLDRITVQETAFFRDPNQFAAFRDRVLNEITEPVTIWSAGCSNGQEPYSLAIALADFGSTAGRVIASDISTNALERTRRARYSESELGPIGASIRERHFVPVGAEWEVSAPLRQRVSVVHHNLVAAPPPFEPGRCEVVFCRNVLIYLNEDQAAAFLVRLAQWIRPGGWLFLGYSESLQQLSDLFRLERVGSAFVYRRKDRSDSDSSGARVTTPDHPRRARPGGAEMVAVGGPSRFRTAFRQPESTPARRRKRSEDEAGAAIEVQPGASSAGDSQILDLFAEGEAAVRAGDYPSAVTAFRKCIYVESDHFLAHFNLGLALEASGDSGAAQRAYASARAALERSGSVAADEALGGYHVKELAQVLEAKLNGKPRR